jgi:broad specificity phosphatase PhoE
MQTRVILVRHGETYWNHLRRFQGREDTELNLRGRHQAELLAKALEKIRLDAIYSSPLKRAYDTAGVVADSHNLQVIIISQLTEISHGLWEGLSLEEIKERYPQVLEDWWERPETVAMPEGESLEDVRVRAMEGIDIIVRNHPYQTVLAVSHDAVNKVILCSLLGIDLSRFWQIKQGNTGINIIDFIDGKARISLLNDNCHLGGLIDETAAGAL